MILPFRPEVDVLGDESGALAAKSPLPQYGPSVPRHLELRDDLLIWSYWDPRSEKAPSNNAEAIFRLLFDPPEPVDVTGMLDDFVRITDGSDVLDFAARYGVLAICEHGLPDSHNPPPLPIPAQWAGCKAWGEEDFLYWEPVDTWLQYVTQMRALLSLAVDLRAGKPGRTADWQRAYAHLHWVNDTGQGTGKDVGFDRIALSERVSTWMQFGNVRPELFWEADIPAFRLSGRTFGTLGVQLLFASTKAQGVAICAGCGMPYGPRRKPRNDRRNFCSTCGEKVAGRLRKRDSRNGHPKGGKRA